MKKLFRIDCVASLSIAVILMLVSPALSQTERISLDKPVVLFDSSEVSFVQYAAKDLGAYLTELTGGPVAVSSDIKSVQKARSAIVIGQRMTERLGVPTGPVDDLGEEGLKIRSTSYQGRQIVSVVGGTPHGTNAGIATLMQMIHLDLGPPYLEGPLDRRSVPRMAVRALHLNGGVLNYPYSFRSWKEEDWKRFVDIAWAQRANLIMLWPFMEIMPVPLSTEDEAYLQEVRRIVEYAQQQRGIRVWIMHAANRIGLTDCGTRDPRWRMYWTKGCQEDLDPSNPQNVQLIQKSLEALYKNVNNADGFCMIDSDPGGWPNSPVSEQINIFRIARQLLDRYNIHSTKATLVDWMWVGWGRHSLGPTDGLSASYDWTKDDPSEPDVTFMAETIRTFKREVAEPWELIAGFTPYLRAAADESVLNKTTYLPYAVVENDVFPATNLDFASVRRIVNQSFSAPGLKGVMGNNQMVLLQFPSTYYFFASCWDEKYGNGSDRDVLQDVADSLYPEHQQLIADSFLALRETEPDKIRTVASRLAVLKTQNDLGKPGSIGRFLFPDRMTVVNDLSAQLQIRLARQNLIKSMQGNPDKNQSMNLVKDYFDNLLAWNEKTGWDKLMDEGSATPIYDSALLRECGCQDKELARAMSRLKQILLSGNSKSSYAQISEFFSAISRDLLKKYSENSVMVGCVEPFKLAVIQTP